MYATYKLKSGKTLIADLWDLLEKEYNGLNYSYPNILGVKELLDNKEYLKEKFVDILKDEERKSFFFEYEGEKIFINSFEKISLEEMIEKINNKEFVSYDDVILTLMENSDSFAVIIPLEMPDFTVLGFSSTHSNNKKVDSLCIPDNSIYNRSMWDDIIEFVPVDEYEKYILGNKVYDTSDLYGMICDGKIKILDKESAIKNYKSSLEVNENDKKFVRSLKIK